MIRPDGNGHGSGQRVRNPQPTGSGPVGARWTHRLALTAAVCVGVCEMLVTTPWIAWDWAPGWLASTVVLVGFLAILASFGFVGNAAVGTVMLVFLWRGWGMPFWRAALLASPYWVVVYRLSPKPW